MKNEEKESLKIKTEATKVQPSPNRGPELEAEIYYLTAEEGGRSCSVKSGYRGQFYYNGGDWDAPQEFIDKEICNPGETVKVYLQTCSPHFHIGQLSVGQEFEIREGAITVGRGRITKILRSDFIRPCSAQIIPD
jgi:translation elongation factor EF-Tu-like GTPase